MNKTLKVVLIVLSVLLILCAVLGIWQRENIFALIDGVKYSQEELSNLVSDNEKIITEALDDYSDVEVREVEDHELAAFEEGKISQDDLVQIVLGQTSLEKAIEKKDTTTPEKEPEKPKPQNPEPSSNGDSEVAALIARIYVLKSTYVGKLDSLIAEAKSEYIALPDEKRNTSAKQKILSAKIGKAASLESECNAAVEGILSELSTVLKKYNRDMSLVESIRKAYANEKQLKKSYYISKYLN